MAFDATLTQQQPNSAMTGLQGVARQIAEIAARSAGNGNGRLAVGQHLFRAGESGGSVYVLLAGVLKTYVTSSEGEEQILAFYSAGDVIGLDGMIGGRHGRSTLALSATEFLRVPAESLMAACVQDPALQLALMEGMSREIQRLQGMLRLERMTADQRMGFFLLNQARRQATAAGSSPRSSVQLPMSRGEIGRFLDLATETVSRCLTRMQASGTIRITRGGIDVLDNDALQQLVQGSRSNQQRLAA